MPDLDHGFAVEDVSGRSTPVSVAMNIPRIVITGASAGVGRATAMAFARRGCRVALMARGRARLESAKEEVERAGGVGLVLPVDVAEADAVFQAADEVIASWGGIDVWINNAMATIFAPVQAISPAEFLRVTQVTYLGQVHGTLAALRHMRKVGRGTIVQVGSALSYRSIPLQSAYCASKFAVRGFTDSLRSELEHERSSIRLTMVQLPAVNTPQFDWARSRLPRLLQPVPPIFQPEAVAEAIVEAAMDAPRELWIGSSSIKAILGTMAVPPYLDRLLSVRGWAGQMTWDPAPGNRAGNLFDVPPGDPGSHGRFDRRSQPKAFFASASVIRAMVAIAMTSLALLGVVAAHEIGRRSKGPYRAAHRVQHPSESRHLTARGWSRAVP